MSPRAILAMTGSVAAGVMPFSGLPWHAKLILGLAGLGVYAGRQYQLYRLGCRALDRVKPDVIPDVLDVLAHPRGSSARRLSSMPRLTIGRQ